MSSVPQERATKISHGNTARQALDHGDEVLGKLCGAIASDESRHEIAYTRIVDEFFRWGTCWVALRWAALHYTAVGGPCGRWVVFGVGDWLGGGAVCELGHGGVGRSGRMYDHLWAGVATGVCRYATITVMNF